MNGILKWLLGYEAQELQAASWRVGFAAEYGNYFILGAVVTLALLVWLVVRSYRREGKTAVKVKAALAGLRIAAILLVAAAIFRPAIVLEFVEKLYSSVVIVVDDSQSMAFKDRYSDEAVKAQLMNRFNLTAEQLAEMSRSDLVRLALATEGSPLQKLTENHPVILMEFGANAPGRQGNGGYTRELGRLSVIDRTGQAQETTATSETLKEMFARLDNTGFETNLAAAIRDAVDSQQGRRVSAVVMVSDFQATSEQGADRLTGALRYAQTMGRPIVTVLTGDTTPPRNLTVAALQAPREARSGAEMEVSAVISQRNLAGETATVRIQVRKDGQSEWQDTPAKEQVKLGKTQQGDQANDLQTVAMRVIPGDKGRYTYRAVVDSRPDEQNAADNSAEAVVEVLDDKINVLLVSGDAGWEFQYLRDLLHRSDIYRLSVWQQNADPEVSQTASTGMKKLSALPKELKQLIGDPDDKDEPGYDVIILYDPQARQDGFDDNFVAMLKDYVQVHGGGLCFVAGNKYFESNLLDDPMFKDLADLLPIEPAHNRINYEQRIGQEIPVAWPVQLTSYGMEHPLTRLGQSIDDNRLIWQWSDDKQAYGGVLPGIYWSQAVARIKPIARVLAVSSDPTRRTAKKEPEPLLAVQPSGKGTVLYMGFDSTWRWLAVDGGAYHRRYWTNVVQFLASLKVRQIVITAGGDTFSAGEEVTIDAEVFDEQYHPVESESVTIEAVNVETGDAQPIQLHKVERRPGRYRANIAFGRTGSYELTMPDISPDKVSTKRLTIELPKAESRRTEADELTAARVAAKPAMALKLWEIDRLADQSVIPHGVLTRPNPVYKELWDTHLWLLLAVVLLTVEWVLRKKHNMT